MREWIDALRARRDGAASYRQPAVTREVLLRAAEQPGCATSVRIGAAVMLAEGLVDEERERLRQASQTSASKDLRDVFAAVLADDERRLDRVIGGLR